VVSRIELIGGVQHMVPQTLARGYQAVETLLPALNLIIIILTTCPDPVPFELGAQALQLGVHLGLQRIVPVQVRLCQLMHDVGVYMDGWHGNILLVMMLALYIEHCNVSAGSSGKLCPRQNTFACSLTVYRPSPNILPKHSQDFRHCFQSQPLPKLKNKALPQ
jgi:hypothetical protein